MEKRERKGLKIIWRNLALFYVHPQRSSYLADLTKLLFSLKTLWIYFFLCIQISFWWFLTLFPHILYHSVSILCIILVSIIEFYILFFFLHNYVSLYKIFPMYYIFSCRITCLYNNFFICIVIFVSFTRLFVQFVSGIATRTTMKVVYISITVIFSKWQNYKTYNNEAKSNNYSDNNNHDMIIKGKISILVTAIVKENQTRKTNKNVTKIPLWIRTSSQMQKHENSKWHKVTHAIQH